MGGPIAHTCSSVTRNGIQCGPGDQWPHPPNVNYNGDHCTYHSKSQLMAGGSPDSELEPHRGG